MFLLSRYYYFMNKATLIPLRERGKERGGREEERKSDKENSNKNSHLNEGSRQVRSSGTQPPGTLLTDCELMKEHSLYLLI